MNLCTGSGADRVELIKEREHERQCRRRRARLNLGTFVPSRRRSVGPSRNRRFRINLATTGCMTAIGDFRRSEIYVNNLTLLKPPVIKSLQRVLADFPGWEIMVAVSVRGAGEAWPEMGLTIRAHEIVDGLQRQYFPKEFQNIEYEGSRRGTDRD